MLLHHAVRVCIDEVLAPAHVCARWLEQSSGTSASHVLHAVHKPAANRNCLSAAARMQIKTEFMQLWDDLARRARARVLVVGATNRPNRLNDAVWRRFGFHFNVRAAVLRLLAWPCCACMHWMLQHVFVLSTGLVRLTPRCHTHAHQQQNCVVCCRDDFLECLENAAARAWPNIAILYDFAWVR